jgi:DNA replication protein DnaC
VYEEGAKRVALSVLSGINCGYTQTFSHSSDVRVASKPLVSEKLMRCCTRFSLSLSLSLSAASVFAYGQTSSGKTYTMVGITEQSMSDIYDYIDKVIFFGGSEVLN